MRNSTSVTSRSTATMRMVNLFIVCCFFFISSSNAQLLQWNTFGNAGTETTEASTTNNTNIAAANLNFTGSTVTPAGNGNRFGGSNWGLASFATDKYIQFTVTPNAGFSFTPTSLVFIWDRSGTGPQNLNLRSSVDAYATDLGTLTGLAASTSAFRTITISGLANITTATTFRLYGWGATGTGGTGGFDCAASLNNVILNGTTAATVTNYTFAYNANGGTGTAPAGGGSYASGTEITVAANTFTRTGYTFSGWNTAANGSGTPYAPTNTFNIAANTTLYAQWAINTYTVTYFGNGSDGGSVPSDGSSPYNYNSNVTVLGPQTMTRAGYTFDGWNTQADGNGTDYLPNAIITGIAANVSLYAKWILANSYSVTYLGNGSNNDGDAPSDPNSPYTGGTNVTILGQGDLLKTGHTFSGWNTAANGSGTAYSANQVVTGIAASITLYAQWTINTYNVLYDGNTNDGGAAPVDGANPHTYNTSVTVLGAGTLTKTNYNFTGWNTAADGNGTAYAAGGSIPNIAADITLYAQWSIITYTVMYDGNTNTGGNAPLDISSPYNIGSNVTVLGVGTLVKTGHTYSGWNTAADGSGTAYAAGSTISNLSANTVLYAQWTINTYTVTYNGNGNTGGDAPVDGSSPYTFGSTVTVLTNSGGLVKTSSSFVGWNTAANGTGTDYAATGSATFTLGTANVVLYAKWAEPLYESFSYTVGENIGTTTTSGGPVNNWFNHSGTGAVAVTTGSLSYTGLQASAGNKVRITNSVSSDVNRPVTFPSGSTVGYYSLLISVANSSGLNATGDYFAGFSATSGTTGLSTLFARLFARSNGAGFQIGITNSGNAGISYNSTTLTYGTTYFIVVKYDLADAANDIATLWVDPSTLGGSEPVTGSVSNSTSALTTSAFASVFFRNTTATPNADIDELRAGPTYASVTPAGNFTITATAQSGGSISPAGAVVVNPGDDQTFTITPSSSPCFDVADVLVDGESVGPVKTYTFSNVAANHTISVSFSASTYTQWTGAESTDWNNAANWTSCVPDASLYVYIPANNDGSSVPQVTQQPVLSGDATTNTLELGSGASLTIGSNTLTITGGYADAGGSSLIGSANSNLVFTNGANLSSALPVELKNLTVTSGTLSLFSAVNITGGTAANTAGTVTVASGAQIESNGFLTIKSNEFGTASIAAGDDAGNYITGDVTVERYLPNNGFRSWRLLSVPTFGSQTIRQAWQEGLINPSPMQNNLAGFGTLIPGTGALAAAQAAGFDNVVANASLQTWGTSSWVNAASTNSPIETKKGYMLFVRGDRGQALTGTTTVPTILRTKGQLYQGTQTIPAFAASSFNAVGNLYASAIDFTLLPKTGGTRNVFYIWDSKKLNGTSLGAYQTFSATNGFQCTLGGGSYVVGQVNTKIESGQAFMVSTTASAGTITLTESSKIVNSANLGFRPVAPASLVKLDSRIYSSNSSDISDAAVVVFDDRYSNAVADEDAIKMTNPVENLSIEMGGKLLAVEGRHTIADNDHIQFKMWNLKQQQYKLELLPQNMNVAGLTATLEDAYLKTSTPVSMDAATIINFTVDANVASQSNRFKVVFTKTKTYTSKPGYSISPNPVENGMVNIMFQNQAAGKYNVRIIDNSGRSMSTAIVNHAGGNSSQVMTLPRNITTGIYQVEITGGSSLKTVQQLIIKSVR